MDARLSLSRIRWKVESSVCMKSEYSGEHSTDLHQDLDLNVVMNTSKKG